MNDTNINKEYYSKLWNDNTIGYLSQSSGARWFEYLLGLMLSEMEPDSIISVADIGCGVGNKSAYMANYFKQAEVIGYDFSSPGIAAAKRHHKIANLSFSVDDATQSLGHKNFDLITAFDVLEHIDDWSGLMKKLIAMNNKYILISSPVGRMRKYESQIGHVRNFKKNEIENFMVLQGYKATKVFYAGFPFYSPIIRDVTNAFYKPYSGFPGNKMSYTSRLVHNIWYILFRYCSSKIRGDIFVGLFEKTINIPSNRLKDAKK